MLMMIDNYDSFTYNLVQYFGCIGQESTVFRNDQISVDDAIAAKPEMLVISPGPGVPEQAGISVELVRRMVGELPILGVCLGHQSIGAAFGAKVVPAQRLMHGKTSQISHDGKGIYQDMPNPFRATRYHSLAIDRATLPDSLIVSAQSEDGEIMGIRHKEHPVEGVQFHPESILTDGGLKLLQNFTRIAEISRAAKLSVVPAGSVIKDALAKVIDRQDLSEAQAAQVMDEIMEGGATNSQIAALLTAMRMKGETMEEIAGFVQTMRSKSISVDVGNGLEIVDTCGTGGDKLSTFNISTCAAFVAAGAGVPVAKHGNRAASSKCGSADVLEELGVNISLSSQQVAQSIYEVGIGFMFAPALHPAMKHALTPRKEMGIRTVFNLLGPMANPAGAKRQVLGVFLPEYTQLVSDTLLRIGSTHAMVFHGLDGLDEISTLGPTLLSHLKNGKVTTTEIDAARYGIRRANASDLHAGNGSASDNARALTQVLEGNPGPMRDIVLINTAAALVVSDLARDLGEGIAMAAETIDSGRALAKLNELKKFTQGVTAK